MRKFVSIIAFVFFGVGWLIVGRPMNDLAGLFWPELPAPWEKVDAFYYPDRHNLSVHRGAYNVDGIAGCRSWVTAAAAANFDPRISCGDYECAIGKLQSLGDGLTVYRLTVR
jgi:hypothetical protein